MIHRNPLIDVLRSYAATTDRDAMYDENIAAKWREHALEPLQITPPLLEEVLDNFRGDVPKSVILTGTAGDGKTHHCRRVLEALGADLTAWDGRCPTLEQPLPAGGKLTVVKDLSALNTDEKEAIFARLERALKLKGGPPEEVFLVAANDGQILSLWKQFVHTRDGDRSLFGAIERLIVHPDRPAPAELRVEVRNLSRFQLADTFESLLKALLEHQGWDGCRGCPRLDDTHHPCPIRLNRELLRRPDVPFRRRLLALVRLAGADGHHLPMRELLQLAVTVLLGDSRGGKDDRYLTCERAHERAERGQYGCTNPFDNACGGNLASEMREQMQALVPTHGIGLGQETDNRIDDLLVFGPHHSREDFDALVAADTWFGDAIFRPERENYLRGRRDQLEKFLKALKSQRRRLFFTLPEKRADFNIWRLTAYHYGGRFLDFADELAAGRVDNATFKTLIRGLNRAFTGTLIDESDVVFLAVSGGHGRGRIARLVEDRLEALAQPRSRPRLPYITAECVDGERFPHLVAYDPAEDGRVDRLPLHRTHFEYLMRIAHGSLPTSFSRQCYEELQGFKLRLIQKLAPLGGHDGEINLLHIDDSGRATTDRIEVNLS